ncbi:ParB/RepB/Spo0J family partition protein [Nocardia brasiliensis]|uniref:ParB/RepB/Spo0J family partition protein n=1 Tax=Nocardia brasiliensis TaxID=37326 RepID=UPI002456E096|nr:ParB N-terminal domain-containing protein [Nocardia brasiliensis]
MTSTIDTEPAGADPADSNDRDLLRDERLPQIEAGFIHPADLFIDGNVRQNFSLDNYPAEHASIEAHGVEIPIKAVREADGRITVIDGQIRTLIAITLGLDEVPVWIEPAPELSPKEREAARIIEQINVNDRRIPLTAGDRAAGVADLLHLGLSVTRVAKAVQEKDLDTIRRAGRVGASSTARTLVDDNQLDLDQAAILADFDTHGDIEAVQRLLDTPRGLFAYEANLIARERENARARFQASLPYAAMGFAVLAEEPDSIGVDGEFLAAEALCTEDLSPVAEETLYANPGGWSVFLEVEEDGLLVDRETGEIVDRATVDWRTKNRSNLTAADGRRHADSVEHRDLWTPRYFLSADQLGTSGFQLIPEPEPEPEEPATKDAPAQDDRPPAVEEDSEAVRAAAERARAEQQARAEAARQAQQEAKRLADHRKELDKQFAVATATRVKFLAAYLARGSVPPQAIRFILEALTHRRNLLDTHDASKMGLQLLDIEGWWDELDQTIEKARPGRYAVLLLGLVCGAHESRIGKSAWSYNDPGTKHYLHFLSGIGHHLVATEQAAAGDLDPMTIDT